MSGYLVVMVCAFDTLPLGLFASRKEAERFAQGVESKESNGGLPRGCLLDKNGHVRLAHRPLGVGVVPFADGRPGEMIGVKTL